MQYKSAMSTMMDSNEQLMISVSTVVVTYVFQVHSQADISGNPAV